MPPASCRLPVPALARAFASQLRSGLFDPVERRSYSSWPSEAVCPACRPGLTSLPNSCWAFRELTETASCAARISVSGIRGGGCSCESTTRSSQDSGTISDYYSFQTLYVYRVSRKLQPASVWIFETGALLPTLLPMEADNRFPTAACTLVSLHHS